MRACAFAQSASKGSAPSDCDREGAPRCIGLAFTKLLLATGPILLTFALLSEIWLLLLILEGLADCDASKMFLFPEEAAEGLDMRTEEICGAVFTGIFSLIGVIFGCRGALGSWLAVKLLIHESTPDLVVVEDVDDDSEFNVVQVGIVELAVDKAVVLKMGRVEFLLFEPTSSSQGFVNFVGNLLEVDELCPLA